MNILELIASLTLLAIAVTIHEFAHGWTAYKLGDSTAKYSGRLTLNPLAHIDPFWTVLLPLFLFLSTGGRFVFGAAKPVPINYWSLKNPKRDIILIGASGPLANFLLAAFLGIIMRFTAHPLVTGLFTNLIVINLVLGVFNLIPIPPLDGSRIVTGLLPHNLSLKYASLEPYGFFIVMALVAVRALDVIVWPLVYLLVRLIIP